MENLEIKLENDINYQISIIKISLLEIKKLCVDKQQAYLYKDVIINLTNNILFLFFSF
jgi:hypothetical protein